MARLQRLHLRMFWSFYKDKRSRDEMGFFGALRDEGLNLQQKANKQHLEALLKAFEHVHLLEDRK